MTKHFHQSIFDFALNFKGQTILIPLDFVRKNYSGATIGKMESKDLLEVSFEVRQLPVNAKNTQIAYSIFNEDIRNQETFITVEVSFKSVSGYTYISIFLLTCNKKTGASKEGPGSIGYAYLKDIYSRHNKKNFLKKCL